MVPQGTPRQQVMTSSPPLQPGTATILELFRAAPQGSPCFVLGQIGVKNPRSVWESWELGITAVYDAPLGLVVNFVYDVSQVGPSLLQVAMDVILSSVSLLVCDMSCV